MEKYFIVATDMFQNGLSSSPSNTEAPYNGPNFPLINIRDNVNAGYKLITEVFKVKKIKAVVGFSMGAQQAFQWAVSYPKFMEKIVGIAGSAVEYPHGKVRLEGFISAIKADSSFDNGNYNSPPEKGLRAGGTHWSSWGWSQEWFRKELYKEMGLKNVDEVINWFEEFVLTWDANNPVSLSQELGRIIMIWELHQDLTEIIKKPLDPIKAEVLYMPRVKQDMYFHIDALRSEAKLIPRVNLKIIPIFVGAHCRCWIC